MHGFKGRFPLWHDICNMFDDAVKRQEETRQKRHRRTMDEPMIKVLPQGSKDGIMFHERETEHYMNILILTGYL